VHAQVFKLGGARPELGAVAPQAADILRDDNVELPIARRREHCLIAPPRGCAAADRCVAEAHDDLKSCGLGDTLALAELILDGRQPRTLGHRSR